MAILMGLHIFSGLRLFCPGALLAQLRTLGIGVGTLSSIAPERNVEKLPRPPMISGAARQNVAVTSRKNVLSFLGPQSLQIRLSGSIAFNENSSQFSIILLFLM